MYVVEMALCGMIYIPSFMMLYIGVQITLRFCFRNVRGRNVGVTDWRDL
jgi:hypothetical protein